MPPKKPAPAGANKKTQEKKKEKIIEVKHRRCCSTLLVLAVRLGRGVRDALELTRSPRMGC